MGENRVSDSRGNKKRQHFVPQFYLRGFQCDANKVFVLDKGSGKVFKKPIPSFCQGEYLYESDSNDPDWYAGKYVAPSHNENGLSNLERSFAPVLKRIVALSALGSPFLCVSKEETRTLSLLVANLIARNPEILFPLRDDLVASPCPESLAPYREVMEILGLGAAFSGVANESIVRHLLLKTDEHSLQGAMATDLDDMEGIILRASKDVPFVMSSFPVFPVIGEVDGVACLTSLYFPLCSEAAIVYGVSEYSGIRRCASVSGNVVNRLNAVLLYSGYGEFLAAKSREALKGLLAFTGRR